MSRIRKILGSAVAAICLVIALAVPTLAVDPTEQVCKDQPNATICEAGDSSGAGANPILGPDGIITRIVQAAVFIAGIISVIMIFVGGMRMVFSNGESGAVASARTTIIYAVVGLVIALFAQALVSFVLLRV